MDKSDFHQSNTASSILAKIGSGCADADFARAIHLAVDRATETQKKARVVVTVEIEPRDEVGALVLRAAVEAKLPKLRPPATQMHVGPSGELMTQMEFLVDGGTTEVKPITGTSRTASGRHTLASIPATRPVAAAPTPAPLVGTNTDGKGE